MALKLKTITVHYLPTTQLPPETFSTEGKAGYGIQSDENGIIGYRIYTDTKTVLIPTGVVHKIETDL